MVPGELQGRFATIRFTGTRSEFLGILLRGYLMMVPTIGVYRFWLTTWKRRFYWSHTEVDGDPLEYTGRALQLLIGFLLALTFFLPLYGVFFYLSTQTSTVAITGYAAVSVLLWFLSGYAIYRARDFRLSRTLWRGIRFDQGGSAWGYAWRRFGWSILMLLTLGLVYPLMAGNLWRYRYSHTWYGDRQFSFVGRARTVAGPFYLVYGVVAGLCGALVAYAILTKAYRFQDGGVVPDTSIFLMAIPIPLVLWLGVYWYQAREVTRMLSAVRAGPCALLVRLRARDLIGQFVIYSLALTGVMTVLGIIAGIVIGIIVAAQAAGGSADASLGLVLTQNSLAVVTLLIFGYLVFLGAFTLLGEVILGFGYWLLVTRGAVVSNVDSLRSVRARGEDTALAGEGLADALNVGAY